MPANSVSGEAKVVAYLLERGLVSPQSLVGGDLIVLDASRRNANYQVFSEPGPSYLVKQAIGSHKQAMVANEAAVYSLLAGLPSVRCYLPHLCLYSPEDHLLVLELVAGARNMAEYHRRGHFSVGLASELGKALAMLHSLDADRVAAVSGGSVQAVGAPSILSIHRPSLPVYEEVSIANLRLIVAVQRFPDFCRLLDELRGNWRTECLVHYDLKWENLLVVPAGRAEAPAGSKSIKIVDWEMAGVGDPAWDLGSIFGEYLGCWLLSIPSAGDLPPDRLMALARYPLSRLQPAIKAFWTGYSGSAGLAGVDYTLRLVRAVEYSAVRLLQTAIEHGQMSGVLTGNALALLQLSFNILQRPEEATVHLLGLPLISIPLER